MEDCNEALVKIKMAFRPAVTEMRAEQAVAHYNAITLQDTNELAGLGLSLPIDIDQAMQQWNEEKVVEFGWSAGDSISVPPISSQQFGLSGGSGSIMAPGDISFDNEFTMRDQQDLAGVRLSTGNVLLPQKSVLAFDNDISMQSDHHDPFSQQAMEDPVLSQSFSVEVARHAEPASSFRLEPVLEEQEDKILDDQADFNFMMNMNDQQDDMPLINDQSVLHDENVPAFENHAIEQQVDVVANVNDVIQTKTRKKRTRRVVAHQRVRRRRLEVEAQNQIDLATINRLASDREDILRQDVIGSEVDRVLKSEIKQIFVEERNEEEEEFRLFDDDQEEAQPEFQNDLQQDIPPMFDDYQYGNDQVDILPPIQEEAQEDFSMSLPQHNDDSIVSTGYNPAVDATILSPRAIAESNGSSNTPVNDQGAGFLSGIAYQTIVEEEEERHQLDLNQGSSSSDMDKNSDATLKFLEEKCEMMGNANNRVQFKELAQGSKREQVAQFFYELLVLKTRNKIDLDNSSPDFSVVLINSQ